MSNAIFPTLPGLKWDTTKTPIFKTIVHEAASGKESTASLRKYPRWKFSLAYEVLDETGIKTDLRTLGGFFLARRGSFDSFLYQDETDCSVTGQAIGTGDGTTAAFQLVRSFGEFTEPMKEIQAGTVYQNGSKENLLKGSRNFAAAAWSQLRLTATSGSTDELGGTEAAAMRESTDGSALQHQTSQVIPTQPDNAYTTFSVYLKAGSRSIVSLTMSTKTGIYPAAMFDITAGTIRMDLTTSNVLRPKIEGPINGYYRCSASFPNMTGAGAQAAYLIPLNSSGQASYTGNGSVSFYAAHPQIESATDYARPFLGSPDAAPTLPATINTATGIATWPVAPANGSAITADFSFYFRCRFMQDEAEFSQFMQDLWELKQIDLVSKL